MPVLLALALSAGAPPPASAHPHVWIDMTSDLHLDEDGRFDTLRINWVFDEFYSAFAVEGVEKKNGTYDKALLDGLAAENLQNLAEWNYFTEVTAGGLPVETGTARDGVSTWDDATGRLTLSFTLPMKDPPVPSAALPVELRIYDPSYYISIDYAKGKSIVLSGAGHDRCTVSSKVPDAEHVWTALPESAFTNPSSKLGSYFAPTATLVCGPGS